MYKKSIALAVAGALICSMSQAQIRKGSLLIGGSAGYGAYKEERTNSLITGSTTEVKYRNHTLSPSFGKAIKDNLIIGMDVTYEVSKEKLRQKISGNIAVPYVAPRDFENSSIGAGFFVRQYWEVARNFYAFGQGRLGFAITREEYDQSIVITSDYLKGWNVSASVYPGLSYAVSRKVHLESTFFNLLTLQYRQQKVDSDVETGSGSSWKKNNFSVSSSFDNATAFTLGVRILLSK